MSTQMTNLSDNVWTKLSDIFTLSIGSSYVIEPEHGRGIMLLAVESGGVAPRADAVGHMLESPSYIVYTKSIGYYVRLRESAQAVTLLLTPAIEFAAPVLDRRRHFSGTRDT